MHLAKTVKKWYIIPCKHSKKQLFIKGIMMEKIFLCPIPQNCQRTRPHDESGRDDRREDRQAQRSDDQPQCDFAADGHGVDGGIDDGEIDEGIAKD